MHVNHHVITPPSPPSPRPISHQGSLILASLAPPPPSRPSRTIFLGFLQQLHHLLPTSPALLHLPSVT